MTERLDPQSLGLSIGVTVGLSLLVLGFLGWGLNYGLEIIELAASFYEGYSPTPVGAVIGAFWGFFDGFIGGYIVAGLYNYFQENL